MHIHTHYSCDSDVDLETCCLKAIKESAGIICFTDHIDLNPHDIGYGYYNAEKYFNEFYRIREKYRNKLTILSGIEFGDPHMYSDSLSEYSSLDYDFILATIHFWYENLYPDEMIDAGIQVDICYEHYWNEILKAVKVGGFDCLGHFDFPKRYYDQLVFNPNKISEIFLEMTKRNICLEINTSTLRKGLKETMPDNELLSIYHDCGGRYVTIGSDAHKAEDMLSGGLYARKLIGYFGFNEVYYSKRIPLTV